MTTAAIGDSMPAYTATLVTSGSASADVIEAMLDDLPASVMLGPDPETGAVTLVFDVEAESVVLAMLAASGSIARHHSRLDDDVVVGLSVAPAV